ncbi:MAG TPA: dihydrodipicolinate synthase family protein [Candidatus Acidoferrales bacterium]|nr:dihydrodipicolinate synthase family protein [Candidatus Acidoferrales bacterium]
MKTTRRNFLAAMGTAVAAAGLPRVAATAMTPAPARPARDMRKAIFLVAAVTPCDRNMNFDEAVYKDILAYFKDQGADGVLVQGSTGEFPSFSVAERKRIMEVALKNKNGLSMIVSSGTPNFPETVELSNHAAEHGADGLLIIPPFYYKHPSEAELTTYYSLIFERVSIPINLYHFPSMSGVAVSPGLLHSLERFPNLAGIKDSNGDAAEYQVYVKEFPKLNMRTGTANNLKAALEAGMGAMLTEGNVYTRQVAAIFTAARQGKDLDEPLAKLDAAKQLMRGAGGGYGAMKYTLMQLMGVKSESCYCRPPMLDATEDQKAQIKQRIGELTRMA